MDQGPLLGDRYELGGLIGRGGMAEVHEGRDTRLGRTVAIKILRIDLARDPSFQTRFRREAQSAASLNHPNIVAVYDTGETERDGVPVPYIVMERVEGTTLRTLLTQGNRLPSKRAFEITSGVLAALDYSHRNGIIHRDVKPSNIMMTTAGDVKVMDFGIARAVADASGGMTQTAVVLGTAQYLSPEQARGEQVDARSDVYGVGCLLYELLTGRPPFTGESPVSVAYQHVQEVPSAPSTIDPDVPVAADAIVLRALAKDPVNRYQSAGDMRADIDRALRGQTVAMPAAGTLEATQRIAPVPVGNVVPTPNKGRRRAAYIALAIAILAIIAALIFFGRSVLGSGSASVHVPNLVGLTQANAVAALQQNKLTEGPIGATASTTIAKGLVISQSPIAGAQVSSGTAVAFVVSAGPQQVTVPNLRGKNIDDATTALTALGLKVGTTTETNANAPAGQVVSTNPAAGTAVTSGTTVNLVVASGNVAVPNVVGEDESTARSTLTGAGFKVAVVRQADSTNPPGTVIGQQPLTGNSAPINSLVTITVAAAPPSTPPPSTAPPTTPATTPPASPSP